MEIRVLAFAAVAEAVGQRELVLTLPEGSTVAAALDALGERHAALQRHRGTLAMAVDMTYVSADHTLVDGDELALIPPVSGG